MMFWANRSRSSIRSVESNQFSAIQVRNALRHSASSLQEITLAKFRQTKVGKLKKNYRYIFGYSDIFAKFSFCFVYQSHVKPILVAASRSHKTSQDVDIK